MDNDCSKTIKTLCLSFSLSFLIAVPFAVLHTGEVSVFEDLIEVFKSPCPLVTDYFCLGSLPATLLNAGICGLFCALVMIFSRIVCSQSFLSGYFLVIAHCFYGLNFLSMMFPVLGAFVFCTVKKKKFSEHFDVVMLSTAFGPFFSELLWRYEFFIHWNIPGISLNLFALFCAVLLSLFLGFVIPPLLEGAKLLHKGFDLYNAGLAFGLLGLVVYSFLYKTLGNPNPEKLCIENPYSYSLFFNFFFVSIFSVCFLSGFISNGKKLKGYEQLIADCGKPTDFFTNYGVSDSLMNIGLYGLLVVLYFNCIIIFTDGVGWTGATCGVTLAAIAFSAGGQTPKNVWPVMAGYILLSLISKIIGSVSGRPVLWTLSSQEYINGLAFATGLCPFSGIYGIGAGIIAGITDAVICTSTSHIHGGLMLYNGGLTAGLTAMILNPVFSFYYREKT